MRRANKLENAVFLIGLVLLAGYNLLQADSLLRDIECQELFQGLLSLLGCFLCWLFDRKLDLFEDRLSQHLLLIVVHEESIYQLFCGVVTKEKSLLRAVEYDESLMHPMH